MHYIYALRDGAQGELRRPHLRARALGAAAGALRAAEMDRGDLRSACAQRPFRPHRALPAPKRGLSGLIEGFFGKARVRDNLKDFEEIVRRISLLGVRHLTFSFCTPYKQSVP